MTLYSRLRCFEQCPKKYRFQYIDKLKIEFRENIEFFLGRRVHETLKKLYQDLQCQKLNFLDGLLDFLKERWAKNWNDSIVIVKKEFEPEGHLEMAEKYISDYYTKYKPFDQSRTIALEKRILVDLNGPRDYRLCVFIDRVTRTKDGCYQIHDYKTCSRLPSKEYFQDDWQLPLYAIALMERYPYIKNVHLVWHLLKFDKEINSRKSDEELRVLKKNISRLIDIIEDAQMFPAKPSGCVSGVILNLYVNRCLFSN